MIESFIFRQFRDKWSVALTGHYNDISKVSTGRSTEGASSRFRSDFIPFFLDTSSSVSGHFANRKSKRKQRLRCAASLRAATIKNAS